MLRYLRFQSCNELLLVLIMPSSLLDTENNEGEAWPALAKCLDSWGWRPDHPAGHWTGWELTHTSCSVCVQGAEAGTTDWL